MCGDQCRRQMLEIGRAVATPFPRPHGRSSAHMASDHLRVGKDARRRLDTTATRSVFDVYFFVCLPCRGPSYQYIKPCILPSNIIQFSLSSCARCQQVPEFNVGNESSTLSAIGSRTPRPDRMTSDAALELSLEQLITALSKKLFGECARIRSTMPPPSRSLVATLTTEVGTQKPKGNRQTLTKPFADRYPREASQRSSTRSPVFEELATTCKPSPFRGPRGLRHFRIRCRSKANRPLDPRLSTLARIHLFQPQELDIYSN